MFIIFAVRHDTVKNQKCQRVLYFRQSVAKYKRVYGETNIDS